MKTGILQKHPVILALALLAHSAQAWVWHGLEDARPVAGPAIQEKDLIGKVVLVYFFTADVCDAKVLARMQDLYESRDQGRFMVVGSCMSDAGIAELVRKHKLAFPVYRGFRVVTALEKPPGTLYAVDEYGRMFYQASDAPSRRRLEKALAEAIAQCGQPPSLTEGVDFVHFRVLKDQLVFGHDISQIEASLRKAVVAGKNPSATPDAKARAAEALRILGAIGRGMEKMVADIRVLMDIDTKRAYTFLGLHLKSFPRDRSKYSKLYDELAARASREK